MAAVTRKIVVTVEMDTMDTDTGDFLDEAPNEDVQRILIARIMRRLNQVSDECEGPISAYTYVATCDPELLDQ